MKKLNLKKILFLVFCLFTYTFSNAQVNHLQTPEQVRAFSKKVSLLLKEDKVSEFFKEFKQYWPMPENELANIEEQTVKGFNVLKPRFGNIEDVVKVKDEMVKDLGIRETYYIKYQNSVIRLIYTYYKSNSGWIINGFTWDSKFSDEFKETQKSTTQNK